MLLLKIASDFTTAPGPRHISEGKFSGEHFRRDVLLPMVRKAQSANETLTVDLDGTSGYATSFLEESFGGLIREDNLPLQTLNGILKFKSIEEPDLLAEIHQYMTEAEAERKKRVGKK